jgi:RNA polymerase sigma factor (TIGR02999 family)
LGLNLDIFQSVSDVTRILQGIREGDTKAPEKLLTLVYEDLRRLAASKMAREAPGQTLQPTALVHEAWLRLVGDGSQEFEGRAHFFAAAAESMRRILVEAARRKHSLKRGANAPRAEFDESHFLAPDRSEEVLAVDEALDALAARDPLAADVVKLRYFVGMTMEEAALSLGLSKRSAESVWTYARVWLSREIRRRR